MGGSPPLCYRCFGKMCRGGAHRGCAGAVVEDTHIRGSKRCMHRPRAMTPEVIVAGNDCRDSRPPTAGGNWAQQEKRPCASPGEWMNETAPGNPCRHADRMFTGISVYPRAVDLWRERGYFRLLKRRLICPFPPRFNIAMGQNRHFLRTSASRVGGEIGEISARIPLLARRIGARHATRTYRTFLRTAAIPRRRRFQTRPDGTR